MTTRTKAKPDPTNLSARTFKEATVLNGSRITTTGTIKKARNGVCPVCGCTEEDACKIHNMPCMWINYQGQLVCSACVPLEALLDSMEGRDWLRQAIEVAEANAFPISAGVLPIYQPCKALLKKGRKAK